jgi:hypothetical protein
VREGASQRVLGRNERRMFAFCRKRRERGLFSTSQTLPAWPIIKQPVKKSKPSGISYLSLNTSANCIRPLRNCLLVSSSDSE